MVWGLGNLLLVDHWETQLPLGQSDSDDYKLNFDKFITQKKPDWNSSVFLFGTKKENQYSSQCPSFLLAQSLGVKRILDFQSTGCALD